jgi:hypothetical protein
MDFRYYEHQDETNTKLKLGEKMIWIGCPNCKKSDGIYKYSINVPIRNGFTNPPNHFTRCVGSKVNMTKVVQECMAAKKSQEEQEEQDGSNAVRVKKPPFQQSLTKNFHVSDKILSLHMWIQKIVIKNMPIYDIECEVEHEMVRYSKVKSVKTVLDTAHNLVEIVEQKISNMMKHAPAGQIMFDGYRYCCRATLCGCICFIYTQLYFNRRGK